MTINYIFKITSVNKLTLYIDEENNEYTNVITKINYYYEGIDEEDNKAIYNSSVSLSKPKINAYKAFSQLTEQDLILWLENAIPENEITLMKSVISNNIDEIKTKSTLPWLT